MWHRGGASNGEREREAACTSDPSPDRARVCVCVRACYDILATTRESSGGCSRDGYDQIKLRPEADFFFYNKKGPRQRSRERHANQHAQSRDSGGLFLCDSVCLQTNTSRSTPSLSLSLSLSAVVSLIPIHPSLSLPHSLSIPSRLWLLPSFLPIATAIAIQSDFHQHHPRLFLPASHLYPSLHTLFLFINTTLPNIHPSISPSVRVVHR